MKISCRIATADDKHLPTFDYTKLSAINMCPTWGIVRYSLHKTMGRFRREMALEAGKLLHDCFSAVRLYQLGEVQKMHHLMHYHGARLFGQDRWQEIIADCKEDAAHYINARNACWRVLETADWVDDPDDKKRTYTALESAIAYYCERWDFMRYPVWVRDFSDMQSDVGIEIPFDVVVIIENTDDAPIAEAEGDLLYPSVMFRYTGRIDGLHVDHSGALILQENKTGKIDRVWQNAVTMSHQPTGYCIAAKAFTGEVVDRALMIGLALPTTRSLVDSVIYQPIERQPHTFDAWARWCYHTVSLHDMYVGNPINAPRYTHSCNQFMRTCPLIGFCTADPEEANYILADMPVEEWSPLSKENN